MFYSWADHKQKELPWNGGLAGCGEGAGMRCDALIPASRQCLRCSRWSGTKSRRPQPAFLCGAARSLSVKKLSERKIPFFFGKGFCRTYQLSTRPARRISEARCRWAKRTAFPDPSPRTADGCPARRTGSATKSTGWGAEVRRICVLSCRGRNGTLNLVFVWKWRSPLLEWLSLIHPDHRIDARVPPLICKRTDIVNLTISCAPDSRHSLLLKLPGIFFVDWTVVVPGDLNVVPPELLNVVGQGSRSDLLDLRDWNI